MHVVTIIAHPVPTSFTAVVTEAFTQVLLAAGHSVDVLDLHREGFDPRYTADDHAYYHGGEVPAEIAALHRRLEAADAFAYFYPVYWWGFPAILKGFIERVFTNGWAYLVTDSAVDTAAVVPTSRPARLPQVPTILIGLAGSDAKLYQKYHYDRSFEAQNQVGIFAYCGVEDVEGHFLYDVENSADNRTAALAHTRELAAAFISPQRKPRHAKEDYFAALTQDRVPS